MFTIIIDQINFLSQLHLASERTENAQLEAKDSFGTKSRKNAGYKILKKKECQKIPSF